MPPTNAETKVQDPKYKNWLRVGLALYYLKVGLLSFIKREVDAMHQSLLQKVSQLPGLSEARCSSCKADDVKRKRNTDDWKFQFPCPSSLCDTWLIELLTFHINPKSSKICWENCDVTAWPFKPWECAKLYMPRGQPITNTGPDMSDPQALLTLMTNCSYFHGKLSPVGLTLTHKMSTIRNRVMHSENMALSDDDRKSFIDDIIHLLEDPTHLKSLEECQQAVAEIDKINKDSVDVYFNHDLEMKALWGGVNDCRQQQGILKNDTELSIDSLKMEIKELKSQVFKNQAPTEIMESGTAAMRSFTLEDIKQAWQSIERELKEELDPANILSFFTFLSENECQAIRCKKKRREMVERFLLRIEENLPDAFFVLLSALEKTGKGSLVNTLENIINRANDLQVMGDLEECRVVALGKNRSGKSATGNNILGNKKEEDKERKSRMEKLKATIHDKKNSMWKIKKDVREENELLQALVGSLQTNTETSSTEEAQSVEAKINQLDKENEKLKYEIILMKEEIKRIEKESKEHPQKPGSFRTNIRKVI